jgi:hypothetical protein
MDAREVREWLAMQVVRLEDTLSAVPNDAVECRPMTDLEWRKLDSLSKMSVYRELEELDNVFVHNLVCCPYDHPITKRQAMLIERVWKRYEHVHRNMLQPPRWIQEYRAKKKSADDRMTTFPSSRVGCFIGERLHPKDVEEMAEAEVIPTEITYF